MEGTPMRFPVPCGTFFFHNFVGIDPSELRNSCPLEYIRYCNDNVRVSNIIYVFVCSLFCVGLDFYVSNNFLFWTAMAKH